MVALPIRRLTRRDVPETPVVAGILNCPICDAAIPLPAPGKAGRPRETCSTTCRDLQRLSDVVVGLISLVQDRCSPAAWLILRGTFWRALNDRPWNKGLRAPSTATSVVRRDRVKMVVWVARSHRDAIRAEARRRGTTTVAMLEAAVSAVHPEPIEVL